MDDVTLKIESGYLIDVPIYEADDCGHNWLAVIPARAPERPGGLERNFCPRGNPPFYYAVESVRVGDVIEFGVDRVGKRGRKLPKRVYGVVKSIDEHALVYTPQPSALAGLAVTATPAFRNRTRRPERTLVFPEKRTP